MSLTLLKRLIMGAVLVFAVSFIFNRPLPSRGNDVPERFEGQRPQQIEQEATSEPTAEATEASGEEGEEPAATGGEVISVGIYVISIDELNLAESYYVMTFYLSFTCQTAECNPEGFEFTNGTIQYMDLLYSEPYYSYKAQVLFRENFDVRRFPFDTHLLTVSIEDSARTVERLNYIVDDQLTDIDPNVVISGWDLNPARIAEIDEHLYPNFNETYSRYTLSIEIARPWLSTIFKALLPIVFILMVGYSLLYLGIERASDTLEIISGALIGAILHHLYLSSLIPPTGYMTLMDAFMSVSYLALVIILFILIRITTLVDSENNSTATRVHNAAIWLVPLTLVALQTSVFLLWFFVFV
jgi:hypothetical protein